VVRPKTKIKIYDGVSMDSASKLRSLGVVVRQGCIGEPQAKKEECLLA